MISAPLVKIKQSIQQLKKENTQMDIRIGVVEHVLLQAKLKDKTSQNKQVHGTKNNDTFDTSVYWDKTSQNKQVHGTKNNDTFDTSVYWDIEIERECDKEVCELMTRKQILTPCITFLLKYSIRKQVQ